jgi:hypothetical protein
VTSICDGLCINFKEIVPMDGKVLIEEISAGFALELASEYIFSMRV